MPSIEEILTNKLAENSYFLWLDCWCKVIDWVLARGVLSRFDAASGRFIADLPPVNDLKWRVRELDTARGLANRREDELMRHFEVLNGAVTRAQDNSGRPYDKRSKPRMRRYLASVQEQLAARPVSSFAVASRSAIDIWRAVADELGRQAYEVSSKDPGMADSTMQNLLLIAGYFYACNLPDERLVAAQLSDFNRSMLSIQGGLVDIVERVSTRGVEDETPEIATLCGTLTLHHQSLTPLLGLLVKEAGSTAKNQGFLSRWLGPIRTPAGAGVDPQLLHTLRKVAYAQYEYSVLAFMALSAIEQLLRTFVHRTGLFDAPVRLDKTRLNQVVTALGGSTPLQEALDSVYDSTRGNLRNRVLHGAQLQVSRSRRQATLLVASPSAQVGGPDAFSPENVCRLCLQTLQILDEHIHKVTALTATDLGWTSRFELTQQHIRFGTQIHCDFVGEEGMRWCKRIDDYLEAVTPNVKKLFDFGFAGWVDRKRDDRLVLFMALNMVLEALFRVSVRIHHGSILKRRVLRPSQAAVTFRYKMLDEHELCAPDILERLVEGVEPMSRATAKSVLTLAVKVRDAVAHGAVTTFDNDSGLAMGHLLVKAIQCLVEAGEHGMTKVAAYFRWKACPEQRTDAFLNWLEGEREVRERIRQTVALR